MALPAPRHLSYMCRGQSYFQTAANSPSLPPVSSATLVSLQLQFTSIRLYNTEILYSSTGITHEHHANTISVCHEPLSISNLDRPGEYQTSKMVTASFLKISVLFLGFRIPQVLSHPLSIKLRAREIADR